MKKEIPGNEIFELSRNIAYKGKIGKHRENFCLRYIHRKKSLINQITDLQKTDEKDTGESITCRKGCFYSSCCMQYVDATIAECEAIVYYLYQNEKVMKLFLKKYGHWLEKAEEIEDTMASLKQLSSEFIYQRNPEKMNQEGEIYWSNRNMCPFLEDNLCLIYVVRPYNCVGYYVTTPLERCDPDYMGEVTPVTKHLPMGEFINTDFYYRKLERPILVCMQKAVFELLEKGYYYLSTISGLESIEKEAIKDKHARNVYRRYLGLGM
jgi:hypothetical protein